MLYTNTLRDSFQKEIISSLEEVSTQGRNNLKSEIDGKLELLKEVSRRISLYEPEEYGAAVTALLDTCAENGFRRMGIISAAGDTYTTDEVELDLVDRPYYKAGMTGKSEISEPLLDRDGNGGINVYSVPVYHDGEIAGVLFATYATEVMREQLAVSSFNGEETMCSRLDDLCVKMQSYSIKTQNKLQIVPSVGVFQIHDPSLSLDYCLDCAGIARKSRKGQFNHFYAFFDEDVKQQIYRNKTMEGEMKPALENGEFTPFYQPQYDAKTKKIVGAEALVRWIRPDGSIVSPGEFIPLFEKNGFISELDKYMFRAVCTQQKKWLDEGYGIVPVSVNVSRKLLYDLNLVEKYNVILEETGLPVRYMEVEITESVFFDNHPRLPQMIEMLHGAGYRILLDDFGTGYSSMEMLQDIPFDVLKIDKSFVDNIGDARGDKVVEGIIHLAESLGLGTIAEGVETRGQYEYLKYHGCEMIQGYYFGRPMAAEAYVRLLDQK